MMQHPSINTLLLLLLVAAIAFPQSDAFSMPQRQSSSSLSSLMQSCASAPRSMALHSESSSAVTSSETTSEDNEEEADDDDDDEYEYVEYDLLEESDFSGSEWLVGTLMDSSPNRIDETWCRLAIDKDGKQLAVWGDNAEGTWKFDKASQFLSVSKTNIIGKKIWAGVIDDYYFAQGTVRGWSFFSAAAVVGQWQAKRLGVDPEEAGNPPWFGEDDEEEEGANSNGEALE
ncbi:unnamed protein product [Cylindrotheca closterium]|uniref:Uncharacterized protein n=1 Tax=Cylindrotheca closterium TaxID=2856 RepID=A0AAD2G5X7_9STRA|nr:unnamed protein product [Cylindrotheca closterium]